MDELIKSLSTQFNLPESAIRSGIGVILNFLKQKAAGTEFEKLVAAIPGADSYMSAAPATGEAGGGLLGGLLGKLGGDLGGAAEALGALQQAGIPMDKAAPLAAEFLNQAKTVVGPETVDALLNQIPALKSLLPTK